MIRKVLLAATLAATGCQEPPPVSSHGAVEVLLPAGSVPAPSSSAVAAAPDAPRSPKKPAPAPATDGPTSIGDVSCTSTAECVVTMRADCCDCCPSAPMAAARGWLTWRDQTWCPAQTCATCSGAACPVVELVTSFGAVCENDRCTRVRAP